MNYILKRIRDLATTRAFILLLVVYAAVFGAIIFSMGQISTHTGGYSILDFEIGYSPAKVEEILSSYGAEGMRLYTRIQLFDLVNPALYALVLAVLTYKVWQTRGPKWLPLVALLGAIGDYSENVTLFLIVRSFPNVSEDIVALSSALSLLKNGMLLVSVMPLTIGCLLWLRRKFIP